LLTKQYYRNLNLKKKMEKITLALTIIFIIFYNSVKTDSACTPLNLISNENCVIMINSDALTTNGDYTLISTENSDSYDLCCYNCKNVVQNCTLFGYLNENMTCLYFTGINWSELDFYALYGVNLGTPHRM
jgi:hypothetical protein